MTDTPPDLVISGINQGENIGQTAISVDELMLAEFRDVQHLPAARVGERWSGTYATPPDRLMIREAPVTGCASSS